MRGQCAALTVSGIVFILMAVGHIFRLVHHWTVVINGVIVPETVSVVGAVLGIVLGLWMFSAACCKKNCKK